MKNSEGMRAEVSDFGALVLSISLLDTMKNEKDVVLGFDSLEKYYNTDTGFGAYIGRNANRIEGANVVIEGVEYKLDENDNGNNLHSGITMMVFSDLCGLQVYSGNFLKGEIGKEGAVYQKRSGICFETQFYPNSCKEPCFPSCVLRAGEVFQSRTIYKFDVE